MWFDMFKRVQAKTPGITGRVVHFAFVAVNAYFIIPLSDFSLDAMPPPTNLSGQFWPPIEAQRCPVSPYGFLGIAGIAGPD